MKKNLCTIPCVTDTVTVTNTEPLPLSDNSLLEVITDFGTVTVSVTVSVTHGIVQNQDVY